MKKYCLQNLIFKINSIDYLSFRYVVINVFYIFRLIFLTYVIISFYGKCFSYLIMMTSYKLNVLLNSSQAIAINLS